MRPTAHGGLGCIPEADVTFRDARSMGRHGYPHRRKPSLRNGLPGEVGKDQAPDKGVVNDAGAQDFFPLPLHCLLVIRGFLIDAVHTYPWLNPYIKGLHLMIDS